MEHPLAGKMYRRTLSFALALSMLFSISPVHTFAAEQAESTSEAVSNSETVTAEECETKFLSAEPVEITSKTNFEPQKSVFIVNAIDFCPISSCKSPDERRGEQVQAKYKVVYYNVESANMQEVSATESEYEQEPQLTTDISYSESMRATPDMTESGETPEEIVSAKRKIELISSVEEPIRLLADTLTYENLLYVVNDEMITITGCADDVTTLNIPSTIDGMPVVAIENNAFRNNKLIEEAIIPESVKSIESGAFSNCTGIQTLTLSAAVEMGESPPFAGCSAISKITLTGNGAMQDYGHSSLNSPKYDTHTRWPWYAGSDVTVELAEGITSVGTYSFYGCSKLKALILPLSVERIGYNALQGCTNFTLYVLAGSYSESYAQENNILYDYKASFAGVLTLSIKTPEDEIMKNGYTVYWYHTNGIVPIANGNTLQGVDMDKQYEYEVILESEFLSRYRQPGRIAVDATSTEELTCTLTAIPSVSIYGRVTDSTGIALSEASVSILRTTDNHSTSVKTDSNGDFSLTIQESGSVATVLKSGYFSVTKSLSFDGSASVNLGDIALTPLPEQKITLTLTRKDAAPEGTQPAVTAIDSLSGLRFTLRDQMTNRQIHFAAQYPELLFDDGEVHGGEVIAIDAVDETGVMRTETVVVTLDEYGVGEAAIPFVSKGSVQASLNGNGANIVMMLFSADGDLIERTVSSGNTIVSRPLPDGNYTAVFMEKSSLLPVIPTLETLAEYRLEQGVDYARRTANVTNGVVMDLGTVDVPVLDESKLSYTIAENTSLTVNAQSVTVGRYVSFRIQYQLDPRYDTSNETLLLDFPESLKLTENSITLDNRLCSYTRNGTRLTIITRKSSGTVRLYGMVTEVGNLSFSASLRFASQGETLTQPIGNSIVQVNAVSLNLPERTGKKQIIISGKAMVGSAVKIADNGTVITETTANKAGTWAVSMPLLHPANNSRHAITAEITTGKGIAYHVGPSELTYHENYCEVERVTMINTAHGDDSLELLDFVTTFEFMKPDTSKHAYNYWPSYPDFTFIVEMFGDAESVRVITADQNGNNSTVDCVWDEASGNWIGTHRYTSYSAAPVGVSVSFTQKDRSGVTQKSGVSSPGASGADERFSIQARETPSVPSATSTFAVSGVLPDKGGNGPVTLCVRGRLLEPNAVVTLLGGNGAIGAKSIYWRNHETLYATFDLSDAAEGAYSLRVACGDRSATRENCFTVDPDLAHGELSYAIRISETAGTGNTLTGYVTATNIGYTDVNAPTLALTGENLLLGNDGGSADAEVLSVFLQNGDGLSGTLAHGETGGCNFVYAPQKDGAYALRLADYATLNGAISAPEGSDAVTERLLARMGGTYPAFAANAARMANALDASLDAVSLETILSAYLQNMAGMGGNAMEAAATDLVSIDLSLSRVYSAPAFADDKDDSQNVGLFGAGWISPYDITAASAIDGDTGVITVTDADSVSLYVRNDGGQYVNILSEQDTASIDGQGRITVTRRSGEELIFDADGKLVSDTDLNGNRITLSYGDGKLSSVTSSDGDSISFAYENGVLSSATSGKTGDTVSYQHDGGRLTAVTTKYGVTRYGYGADGFLSRIEYPDGTFVNYTRDSYGRVTKADDGDLTVSVSYGLYETTTRDSMGHISRTRYDSAGNAVWSIDEENRVSYAFYDDNFRLVRLSQGLTYAVSYSYDKSGLPVRVTLPDGSVTGYAYDTLGNITGVTDPKGQTTVYERDGAGNAIALRYPDNNAETFAYDAQGRVSAATSRSGVTRSYSYDSAGNVTKIEWSTGETIQYAYDKFGNVTAITENGETTALEYNGNGDLTKVTYPDGKSVSYAYDSLGRRISVTDADGYVTGYAYNGQGLLESVTDGVTELIHYDWNPDGTLNRQRNANGTATQYAYGGGNLTAIEHLDASGAVFSAFYYGYDAAGNLTSMTDNSGTWRYGYDGQGQLTRAESPSGDVTEYAYDAAGNRTAVTVNSKTTAYASNALNQYTRYGDVSREHDADGNLIRETGPDGAASYEWDYQGRLAKYTDASGAVYEYGYDAFGLRNRVKADGKETAYLNDPTGYGYALASYGGDTETHYALAGGIAAARIGEATYFYNANHLGSVTELTGDGGAIVNR